MSTMTLIRRLLFAAALAGTLSACDNVSPHAGTPQISHANSITTGGTVVFREKDGGFFGILSDNGGQLEPANLDPQFRSDGLRVKLVGYIDPEHLGRHNWGNAVEVESVQPQKN